MKSSSDANANRASNPEQHSILTKRTTTRSWKLNTCTHTHTHTHTSYQTCIHTHTHTHTHANAYIIYIYIYTLEGEVTNWSKVHTTCLVDQGSRISGGCKPAYY